MTSHVASSGTLPRPSYDEGRRETIARLEGDLERHMRGLRPRRFEHSLSVALTAESLACAYGVDPFAARCAGILHDWDKVLSPSEQLEAARKFDVDLGVDLALVLPLLHGLTAARRLATLYPELPREVFRAIELHTLGSADMTPLDMVVFVADAIEPTRRASADIEEVRTMVAAGAPLDAVFERMFVAGIAYVLKTRRYLYTGTIDTYNQLVLARRS
ncbi:bis(5'-nucleosyl)-tetraphosphatase (symmetrical) YqeK [Olsenella sp. HMSC062G07]|uniref:bis(5'-nucleosyl)-tetraphosphatase (symmetrical) YqeK n=1 Tax=Olsenella sp. HMSC062G07 TaxID=1739330 RepID=UPI0008A51446|nr:bis(5'-nucleosyl)-tetraphosphatase (symmetrical) YqeK [Olsenella sp. HMSC062G07]OFK24303.1 phosphohydrolase [Olsenella sp. HMSC062G07]